MDLLTRYAGAWFIAANRVRTHTGRPTPTYKDTWTLTNSPQTQLDMTNGYADYDADTGTLIRGRWYADWT